MDVGYGQLAWSLRSDSRVVVMERTNARALTPDMFPELMDMAVMDLSFISVRLVLPAVWYAAQGRRPGRVPHKAPVRGRARGRGQKGVVRDAAVHERVLRDFLEAAPTLGYTVMGLDFSPVRGPEGNIEYLAYLKKGSYEAPSRMRRR